MTPNHHASFKLLGFNVLLPYCPGEEEGGGKWGAGKGGSVVSPALPSPSQSCSLLVQTAEWSSEWISVSIFFFCICRKFI